MAKAKGFYKRYLYLHAACLLQQKQAIFFLHLELFLSFVPLNNFTQLPYPGYSLPQEYEIRKYFRIVQRIPKISENKEMAAKLASEKRRWSFNQFQ